MTTQTFVVNCKPHNWAACQRESIFGLKLGRSLPALRVGDLILFRISGSDYGVKALWYFQDSVRVDGNTGVPWTDAKYGWILRCKPITTLPRLFSEDFQTSSKFSTKIGFPASRIQPSIIRLKDFETRAYLQQLLKEFEDEFHATFSHVGETKSIEGFLEDILASLEAKQPSTPPPQKPLSTPTPRVSESQPVGEPEPEQLETTGTPYGVVGERIDLPILNYAPLNEHGVILLFGYFLQDLGFSHLEEIRSGFPDAIGMKSIGNNKYKRVRIEFEFRSSSFVRHKHFVDGCDLIVCWIHDWPECPLEVIELSKVLFPSE